MPWPDYGSLPAAVKTAMKNRGIAPGSSKERQWRHIANGCLKKGFKDSRCVRMANGKVFSNMRHTGIEVYQDTEHNIHTAVDEVTGKKVMRVPAIFTREGVMNKAFKPWDELQNTFWTLERKPIIIPGHPEDSRPVMSVDLPNIVGFSDGMRLDEKDKSVRGWFNYFLDHEWVKGNKENIGKVLKTLSVGYFAKYDILTTNKSFNGNVYNRVERNMLFDHTAQLLDSPAACPVPACGVNINSEGFGGLEDDCEDCPNDEKQGRFDTIIDSLRKLINTDGNILDLDNMAKDKDKPTGNDPEGNAAHGGDCPEGKHMVDGKCVDKNEEETSGSKDKDSKTTTVDSDEYKGLLSVNKALQTRLDALEAVETVRRDSAIAKIREEVETLNETVHAFEEDEIKDMGEKELALVRKALESNTVPMLALIPKSTKLDEARPGYAKLTVFAPKKEGTGE